MTIYYTEAAGKLQGGFLPEEHPSTELQDAEQEKDRAEERLRSKSPETDVLRAETALKRAIARINLISS